MPKAIITRYHGCTNTKPSKISASDSDKNRVFVSYDHELDADKNHAIAARTLCLKMRWPGELVGGSLPSGDMVWVFAESTDRIFVPV